MQAIKLPEIQAVQQRYAEIGLAYNAERMQELRNEPGRGSQTGYWPPESSGGGGPEELQLPHASSAKL